MKRLAFIIDPLPGDRGQLLVDVLDRDGRVVMTHKVGSPAPIHSIKAWIAVAEGGSSMPTK